MVTVNQSDTHVALCMHSRVIDPISMVKKVQLGHAAAVIDSSGGPS